MEVPNRILVARALRSHNIDIVEEYIQSDEGVKILYGNMGSANRISHEVTTYLATTNKIGIQTRLLGALIYDNNVDKFSLMMSILDVVSIEVLLTAIDYYARKYYAYRKDMIRDPDLRRATEMKYNNVTASREMLLIAINYFSKNKILFTPLNYTIQDINNDSIIQSWVVKYISLDDVYNILPRITRKIYEAYDAIVYFIFRIINDEKLSESTHVQELLTIVIKYNGPQEVIDLMLKYIPEHSILNDNQYRNNLRIDTPQGYTPLLNEDI